MEEFIMKKILLLLKFTLVFSGLSAQKTLIWCGSLIDGVSNQPRKNVTIVIEKNKIIGVENGFSTNNSDAPTTIDLKNNTVMPGWIDMHVHLEHETSPTR